MVHNSAAENVFGTLGVVCWTVQLIPQIWKSYRTKDVTGLAPVLVLSWALAGIPLGIYTIVQNTNIPLIVQPQLFGLLCSFSWIQCLYYGKGYSATRCACVFILILVVFGALEAGLVYAIRPSYERGEKGGTIGLHFLSVLTSVTIATGLLPQYYEIYKHKAVIGISITMITVDMLGGVFSDISLALKQEFDPWLAVSYSLVAVMDSFVIIAALVLNPRARRQRQIDNMDIAQDDQAPVPSPPLAATQECSISPTATLPTIHGSGDPEKAPET